MPPLAAVLAAALLVAAYALFGLLVHLLGLAGGAGLSIAAGVAKGFGAWKTRGSGPRGNGGTADESSIEPARALPTTRVRAGVGRRPSSA